jgi:hypothetical protein
MRTVSPLAALLEVLDECHAELHDRLRLLRRQLVRLQHRQALREEVSTSVIDKFFYDNDVIYM